MSSIVLELQRKASKSDTKIVDLLREALVIARKLKLKEFEEWIKLEMNGYEASNVDEIPKYRKINGTLQWFNMVRGWCPVFIEDSKIEALVSNPKAHEPVSEMEDLVHGNDGINLIYQLSTQQKMLISELGDGTMQDFRVLFSKSQYSRMLDTVRTLILEWTLDLEEKGILGEDMSFTQEEKNEADNQINNINYYIENSTGVQIQQDTENSNQTQHNEININEVKHIVNSIEENLPNIDELDQSSISSIEKELKKINKQLEKNVPKSNVVHSSLNSIKTILEGATGSVIAQGLLYQLANSGLI